MSKKEEAFTMPIEGASLTVRQAAAFNHIKGYLGTAWDDEDHIVLTSAQLDFLNDRIEKLYDVSLKKEL